MAANYGIASSSTWSSQFSSESLNSNGHQFHQQNEQSPLILTELTEHKIRRRPPCMSTIYNYTYLTEVFLISSVLACDDLLRF